MRARSCSTISPTPFRRACTSPSPQRTNSAVERFRRASFFTSRTSKRSTGRGWDRFPSLPRCGPSSTSRRLMETQTLSDKPSIRVCAARCSAFGTSSQRSPMPRVSRHEGDDPTAVSGFGLVATLSQRPPCNAAPLRRTITPNASSSIRIPPTAPPRPARAPGAARVPVSRAPAFRVVPGVVCARRVRRPGVLHARRVPV